MPRTHAKNDGERCAARTYLSSGSETINLCQQQTLRFRLQLRLRLRLRRRRVKSVLASAFALSPPLFYLTSSGALFLSLFPWHPPLPTRSVCRAVEEWPVAVFSVFLSLCLSRLLVCLLPLLSLLSPAVFRFARSKTTSLKCFAGARLAVQMRTDEIYGGSIYGGSANGRSTPVWVYILSFTRSDCVRFQSMIILARII